MIHRQIAGRFLKLLEGFSVIILTGPRQSGKTTLCKMELPHYEYYNLEDIAQREAIASAPKDFLLAHAKGLIIDEVQLLPELFSYVQVVVDEHPEYRFVLTGSNNFSLMENITQSLAGRAAVLTLLPLSLNELGGATDFSTDELLIRGGYPAVWSTPKEPSEVYANYFTTYIERDLRRLVNVKDLSSFQLFMRLLAGRVGTEFNASALSSEVGVSSVTARQWLSVLEASYVVFRLPPYYRNVGKRIVKASKLYFFDTGLVCFLLNIRDKNQIAPHPLRGKIFENMVVSEFMKRSFSTAYKLGLFFYRDSGQKEVDLIEEESFDVLKAYEIKSARHYNGSFGAGLTYFKRLYGNAVVRSTVLYDGEDELADAAVARRNVRRFFTE